MHLIWVVVGKMAKGFWQDIKKPVFRSGFIAIGAMIIIISGIDLGLSSTLSQSCGSMCIAGNLAISLGGVMLFIAFVNYTESGGEVPVGAASIIISIILIAFDYIGAVGSRSLLTGSAFAFVGGIFSLIASRRKIK